MSDNRVRDSRRPLRHSEAIAEGTRYDTTGIILFLLTIQLATLFLIGASFYLSTAQARDAAEDARKGVACLIEQMAEHRFAQRAAHQADADNHGYTYTIPAETHPPAAEEVEATRRRLIVNCDGFLTPAQAP